MTYIPLYWALIAVLIFVFTLGAAVILLGIRKADHDYDNRRNERDIQRLANALSDAINARNIAIEKWAKCSRELKELKEARHPKAA